MALRRLRSALTLFRHTVRGKDYQHLREELRWFAGQFGEARNLDVLLGPDAPPPFPDDAGLREALRAEREAAYDRVMAAIESERARAWCSGSLSGSSSAAGGSSRAPRAMCARSATHQLERQWRKVRRHGAELGQLDADAEHQLRIDIKKLRYAAEFLASLYPPRPRRAGAELHRRAEGLQEQLGVANDHRIATASPPASRPTHRCRAVPDGRVKARGEGLPARLRRRRLLALEAKSRTGKPLKSLTSCSAATVSTENVMPTS